MIPPPGFEIAEGFKGFLHKSTGALIMMNEIEAPYSLVLEKFSKEELAAKEMTLVGRQDVKLSNTDATLITATQPENGIENYKKMLLFGEGRRTLLVTAVYSELNPELGASVKRALLSTIYEPPINSELSIVEHELTIPDNGNKKSKVGDHWVLEKFYEGGERHSTATFSDESLQSQDGSYKRWYKSGQLADSNFYVKGKLEGIQTWYYENGQKSEEGTYLADNSKRVKFWTEDGLPDPKGTSGVKPPSFKGDILKHLTNNLRYPERAKQNNLQGRSVIQFEITAQGKIIEPFVATSSGVPELDDEALRVIAKMTDWNPASDHNRRKKVKFTLPITFKLEFD